MACARYLRRPFELPSFDQFPITTGLGGRAGKAPEEASAVFLRPPGWECIPDKNHALFQLTRDPLATGREWVVKRRLCRKCVPGLCRVLKIKAFIFLTFLLRFDLTCFLDPLTFFLRLASAVWSELIHCFRFRKVSVRRSSFNEVISVGRFFI